MMVRRRAATIAALMNTVAVLSKATMLDELMGHMRRYMAQGE